MNHSLILIYASLLWHLCLISSQHTITTLLADPSKKYPFPTLFHLAIQAISREFQNTIHSSQQHDTDTRKIIWSLTAQPSTIFALSQQELALSNCSVTKELSVLFFTHSLDTKADAKAYKKLQDAKALLIASSNKPLNTAIQKTVTNKNCLYAIPLNGEFTAVITDNDLFVWSYSDAQLLNHFPLSINRVRDCTIIQNSIAICQAEGNYHQIKIEWLPLYTIAQKLYITGLINIATTQHCSPEACTFFESIDPTTLSTENASWTDDEIQKVMALKTSTLATCTARHQKQKSLLAQLIAQITSCPTKR